MEFAKIDYEEFFDETQKYSDFCKLNTNGFRGEDENKEGFLIGPSIHGVINKNNKDDSNTYEIFIPKIYLRNSIFDNSSRKTPFRQVIN